MRLFFPILVLVCSAWPQAGADPRTAAPQTAPHSASQSQASPPADQENSRKAKAIVEQAIQALGGQTFLTIRDREQQGRTYGFHHGRASGGGTVFWSFSEFPDRERVEVTKERDIAELYVGDKAYEITYKGARPIEEKDRLDYMRRRRFSLDTILRKWITDPGVIFLYEGPAIAAQHPSQQVTLINSQNDSVTLYVDTDTHLPVKKSFFWRDPVDKQRNLEEEVYDDYKLVSGIMAPFNVTRFFNGDMSNQRFVSSVTINQGLDEAMFDPNSGYNPNKPAGKPSKTKN